MEKEKKLLVLGVVWPEPNSSAAGSRMLQLIEVFKTNGYKITFASAAMRSEFMENLEELGVLTKHIVLNCSSFDSFVAQLDPDVVLFDRFMVEEQFGWRVAEFCPNAIRILDTEDLHCLRKARQNAFKENRGFERIDLYREDVAKREIASILRCDVSLIISKFEMSLLVEDFKINPSLLLYLPFFVQTQTVNDLEQLPRFEEREGFVFIGNFLHEPNWNAVQYLKHSIWPRIRKHLPEATLNVFGAYPSQKVMQLHNVKEGFLIHGRAVNAQEEVSNAKVVLAPLRFGAGLKGKLLEAMQCGTPSVTTSIGAEAMHDDLEWNGVVSDDIEQFVVGAVCLYTNENFWKQAQINGTAIINSCYDLRKYQIELIEKVKNISSNFVNHRQKNFLGRMLEYHTMRSTMFMSKWIEEKNK